MKVWGGVHIQFWGVLALGIALALAGCGGRSAAGYIPAEAWPGHDSVPPYQVNGPLWVGHDGHAWRYVRVGVGADANSGAAEARGILDPGEPGQWGGKTGVFNGDLDALPSGTHLNLRYCPGTAAACYGVDDYMVRVGNVWVDKYESRVVDVSGGGAGKWIDDPELGGPPSWGEGHPGNGFAVPPTWIAVSQPGRGTTGVTWFVASAVAANSGKRLVRNEEWQAAAAGTARTDATGMTAHGEEWKAVEDQDISRYGVVGCAGSLWEWTEAWGQYGQHYDGAPEPWLDWPGSGSFHEWDDRWGGYGDDYLINVAGRAFTRQDSARYATGLPAALVRGGSWGDHHRAGVFALIADGAPSYFGKEVGFRCAR